MDAARWTYNAALAYIRDAKVPVAQQPKRTTIDLLRQHCVNADSLTPFGLDWLLATPYDVRDDAVQDLHKNYASNWAKARARRVRGETTHRFTIAFRRAKDDKQSITVRNKHWGRASGAFADVFRADVLAAEAPLPDRIDYDARLVLDRLGRWWLCLPLPAVTRAPAHRVPWQPAPATVTAGWGADAATLPTPPPSPPPAVMSLDPGVRTFLTGYDPTGRVVEWGTSTATSRLLMLCRDVDRLVTKLRRVPRIQSKTDEPRVDAAPIDPDDAGEGDTEAPRTKEPAAVPHGPFLPRAAYVPPSTRRGSRPPLCRRAAYRRALKHTKRQRLAMLRAQERIRACVKDLHCRCAAWLCHNYDVVLIPKFETARMTARRNDGRRRLASQTARAMYTWSHFAFRQRLQHKASEFGTHVIVCTEEYTSKTCGACGAIHAALGGSKVFRCPQPGCGLVADRDAHAARNILLKWLAK